MNGRIAAAFVVAASFAGTMAWAGHELPIYPSYYPHEIDIATVAPERAVALIERSQIQAYVGADPHPATLPASVGVVESLGSFIVVVVNPDSSRAPCAVTAAVMDDLAAHSGDFVFHPYPVTPFHGDYLYHADLATAAKRRWSESGGEALKGLKVRPIGALAQTLVRGEWQTQAPDWDAEVAEVDANRTIGSAITTVNGWLGPPWLRKGWFQADLLLGDTPTDPEVKARTAADVERLTTGDYEDAAERINLERDLVRLLSGGCRKTVAGFTLRYQYYNNDYSAGIENIAYDSISGFASPMFLRTAKLKDFPWNGWLGLGIEAHPTAAWNPVAGFTDDFGRLMWSTLGDPAVLAAPNDSGWTINRIADVKASPAR